MRAQKSWLYSEYDMFNNTYYRRKTQGMCVYCGKNKARDNRVICESCAQKQSRQAKVLRGLLRENGICPVCGKNVLKCGEKTCCSCQDKHYVWNMNNREKVRSYCAERVARLKAQGICADCGKEKAAVGRVRCEKCLARRREYNREFKAFKAYKEVEHYD